MVLALLMRVDVLAVEVDLAQIAGRIARRLIAEVLRLRIAALAARADRPRTDAIAELDDGDEAVAAGAVHFLGAGIGARAERRERSPARRGEAHRHARCGVVEVL